MKNVLLAITLISGFLIASFLSEAPRRNEFVSDLQVTLTKISQDLPSPSRVANDLSKVPITSVAAITHVEFGSVAAPANARLSTEHECCGWTE